jgi:hypothetical protein
LVLLGALILVVSLDLLAVFVPCLEFGTWASYCFLAWGLR